MKKTVCLNDQQLMKKLENKIEFRSIAKGTIQMIECELLPGRGLSSNERIRQLVAGGSRIVVQYPVSSGGEGTLLIDASNIGILDGLDENEEYLVSKYIEDNIPINAHCVIYDDYSIRANCVIHSPYMARV